MNKLIARSVRCCLAASAALLCVPPAHAQQAAPVMAPAAAGSLEEVIVTARRREESLQDVPIAVSAFSAEELRMLQAEDLAGLQGTVPNMNLVQGRGSANSANVYIRGVGQPDALQTFDPGVGIYLDDVFVARIQGALFNLYDVQRVEVLRGPQGTLYGKNTIGGAIRLISKKPPEEFSGVTELGYGNYDYFTAKAYLGGPVTDTFGASIAGVYATRDGITEDPDTGRDYNDIDTLAGRVILAWDPTEDLNINLAADYTRSRNALNLGRPEAALVQANSRSRSFYGRHGAATGPNDSVEVQGRDVLHRQRRTGDGQLGHGSHGRLAAERRVAAEVHHGVSQPPARQLRRHRRQRLRARRRVRRRRPGPDFAGVPVPLSRTSASKRSSVSTTSAKTSPPTRRPGQTTSCTYNTAPITFRAPSPTSSTRTATRPSARRRGGSTTGCPVPSDCATRTRARTTSGRRRRSMVRHCRFNSTFPYKDDHSWTAWTPTFALDYKLTDDSLLYASASEGFKSGGFNGRANSVAETGAYDPEYVWTYELGTKNTLSDGRLRLNFDVFYSDYTDFQARVSEADDPRAGPDIQFQGPERRRNGHLRRGTRGDLDPD